MTQPTTWRIYEAAGTPQMEGDTTGVCRTCGTEACGLPFELWVRDTFTDRDKLTPGEIICHACLLCFQEQSGLLREMFNKEKPQRFRNYSHFVVGGVWHPLTKGQKGQMRELLLSNPDVAIIAESGQKHIIFRAAPGWWQFEEQRMLPCPELLSDLLAKVEALYNAGASKGEIESGRYSEKTIRDIGIREWATMDAAIKPHRGSLPLRLALFLAQKESDGARTDSE